jgi:hypothetical protein
MIDITSDRGRIGNFKWINTNQNFHFEIDAGHSGGLPRTLPGWWGTVWFGRQRPAWLIRRLDLIMRMLEDEPVR